MPILASDITRAARSLINDDRLDNLSRDNISSQADGARLLFTLVNRNILSPPATSVPSPEVFVNGISVPYTLLEPNLGQVTLVTAPAYGDLVEAQYFYSLISDTDIEPLLRQAVRWTGGAGDFIFPAGQVQLLDPGEQTAAELYLGYLMAKKLSSLSAWFYSAGSGGKNFNKDSISNKWKLLADELLADAQKARIDPYTRYERRNIPATQLGNFGGYGPYTPRR